MQSERPLKILTILGQLAGMTGSGVLFRELWNCANQRGDQQELIYAGYRNGAQEKFLGSNYRIVTCTSAESPRGELPFKIPGMSDVMPYPSIRYSDLTKSEIDQFIHAFERQLVDAIKTFKPDIVHIHHLWVLNSLVEKCENIPTIVTVHGTDLKQVVNAPQFRPIVAQAAPKITRFLSVSKDIMADACKEYNIPKEKIAVIGNGYNETIFNLSGPKVPLDRPTIVCAGKFVRWKGFTYAIRAISQIPESDRPRLVIFGSGPQSEWEYLQSRISEWKVNDYVELKGHCPQEEMASWMRSADCFVLSSVYEPFGLVFLEAMACGCPVIASRIGGAKDTIKKSLVDKGLASLVKPVKESDPKSEANYSLELRDAIVKVIKRKASNMERAEIAKSIANLSWRSVYDNIRDQYLGLLR